MRPCWAMLASSSVLRRSLVLGDRADFSDLADLVDFSDLADFADFSDLADLADLTDFDE